MRKTLYYIMLVITTILLIPFIVLMNVTSLYIRLVRLVVTIPANYVRDAAPMPKWFKWVAKYIGNIIG